MVSVHAEHNVSFCHCKAFRPKQSQKTNEFRLLRFARNDKNTVFPRTLTKNECVTVVTEDKK
jgi:hypothetical protein